ncbi:MAG: hypothetical protein KF858_13510 [Candidatus Sumerlaeia bacterium]|nr:hypothetical protein [Candidatus Sumerlaeia bacterium]
MIWAVALAARGDASTLKVALDTPASVIAYDNGVLLRSDSGGFFEVETSEEPDASGARNLQVIPEEAGVVVPLTLRFRVEGLATPGIVPGSGDIWVEEGGMIRDAVVTDHDLGEGGAGWFEFTHTMDAVAAPWVSQDVKLVFWWGTGGFGWTAYAYVRLTLYPPHRFAIAETQGGPLDRWYRLEASRFPSEYTDGSAWPEEFRIDTTPLPNEKVDIEGTNVRFDPKSVTTDSNGEFGVLAFVDPSQFYAKYDEKGVLLEPAKAKAGGSLRLRYKKLMSENSITGNFCEVIMVEGTVRVMEGSGTVRVGDILYPGQVLSLGASWGQKAQVGLRFVNGSDASLIQDVFTNACLADMIVIGSSGIDNVSVVEGNTPLMSASRALCERIAGLPSTPEQWAKAAGKMVVKGVVSNAVPGSGIVAFAIRYAAKSAAGNQYDKVFNSGSGGKSLALKSGSPARMDLSLFYDGSSRVTHDFADPIVVMPTDNPVPFATVGAGQWQEVTELGQVGRQWAESPDSIDKEGPELRYSAEYFSTASPSWTRLEVRAFDPAGVNPASLSMQIDGEDRTASFTRIDEATWRAEFFGGQASLADATIQASDTVGNQSTLTWSVDSRPGPPVIETVLAGHRGGYAYLDWAPPDGLTADDILYYEVRLSDCLSATECNLTWRSVGADTQAAIPVPAGWANLSFRLAVRACDRQGRVGPAAVSGALTLAPTPEAWSVW